MKIQCNVCEAAEANVVCCADEAALCCACDEKVHAANKLASRHQRVPLSTSSSQMPKCDVCQEMVGYFFCLEDRALLCRKCDLAIHSANEYVSAHQRFLLTGAKVGPERIEPGSSSSGNSHSEVNISNASDTKFCLASGRGDPVPVAGEAGGFGQAKVSFSGESAPGSNEPWHLDEFFGLPEFNQKCGHLDHGTPKGDSGKLGESDCSPFSRPSNDKLDFSDCFGQVPETTWTVPQIPSPPTASGLYWPKNSQFPSFVPDVGFQSPHLCQSNGSLLKRQRRF